MLAGKKSLKMAGNYKVTYTQMKRKCRYETKKTHIALILLTLIIIIYRINKLTKVKATINNTTFKAHSTVKHLQLSFLFTILKRRKSIHQTNTQKTLALLLILLSNDIHPNPGPKPQNPEKIMCIACNKQIQKEDSLQCTSCRGWCHTSCLGINNNASSTRIKDSFQWICSSVRCSPNHSRSEQSISQLISPNKFKPLEKDATLIETQRKNLKKAQVTPKVKAKRKKASKDINLLDELPKISSREYIGKDYCTSCHKEVKSNQQAISCDLCERWMHRICSDMITRIYNRYRKKKHFTWICTKCRRDETINEDKIDVTKFNKANLPDLYTTVLKSKNKELLILHMNCRSINNKLEELENIIKNLDPDIICLTETWMDDSVPSQANIPDGYSMIRKDRSADFKQKYGRNKGGGVAILHKKHIKVEMKNYLTDRIEEILWVHVKVKESFMLGVVYRAEYTDLLNDEEESKLEENLRKACEISNNLIITGDFNVDMLEKESKNTQILNNIYSSYGLTQHINKATRIDKRTLVPTIIDHIWSNTESKLIRSSGTFIGLSDHMGIYMKLNRSKPVPPKTVIKYRNYKEYNVEAFTTQLQSNIDESQIQEHLESNDVNSATESLIKIIQDTVNLHAPLIEKNVENKPKYIPWFSNELREMIKSKNELLQDYFSHGIESYKTRLKSLSNKITSLKRNLKQQYITKKMEEAQGDGKKCWNLLNSITNRQKIRDEKEPDMMTQEKADRFNKFFATIGTEIQKKIGVRPDTHNPTIKPNNPTFSFKEETPSNIEKIIDKIRIDVATGNDNIGAKIIKDIKTTISPILTKIINKSYETKTFPNCMKQAVIKAIHKKESPDDISNYRPISILPTLSKIFERAAVDQLVYYLEENKLLCRNQHAYRLLHSTVTCLVELCNYIYRLLDNKSCTAVASLDLSKAFDSINHQLILKKLAGFGLDGNSISWIGSYLTNRKQTTKFKKYTSKEEIVSSGIPQGSIIGPLLFLCFINDLAEMFTDEDAKMFAYADDTQLVVNAKNMTQLKLKIERVIKIAQNWYLNNSMKNNIGKTEILVFNTGKNSQNIQISVEDEGKKVTIKSKPFIKILGVIMDNKLNWTNQINAVKSKAMNITRNIHRINHLLPMKQRLSLYTAVISPQFSYADIVWGGCTKKASQSLQRIQNFAAKSITGHRKYDSASSSLRKLNLLNLEQRRQIHETVFTHKALLQKNTENINQQYREHLSTANTRQADTRILTTPMHKTSKFESSPLYRTIKSWNKCPPNLPFNNPKQHKNMLQKHYISLSLNN